MTEKEGFSVDRHAASGRKSCCKACDRQRRKAYYELHKDEWNAEREAEPKQPVRPSSRRSPWSTRSESQPRGRSMRPTSVARRNSYASSAYPTSARKRQSGIRKPPPFRERSRSNLRGYFGF